MQREWKSSNDQRNWEIEYPHEASCNARDKLLMLRKFWLPQNTNKRVGKFQGQRWNAYSPHEIQSEPGGLHWFARLKEPKKLMKICKATIQSETPHGEPTSLGKYLTRKQNYKNIFCGDHLPVKYSRLLINFTKF